MAGSAVHSLVHEPPDTVAAVHACAAAAAAAADPSFVETIQQKNAGQVVEAHHLCRKIVDESKSETKYTCNCLTINAYCINFDIPNILILIYPIYIYYMYNIHIGYIYIFHNTRVIWNYACNLAMVKLSN